MTDRELLEWAARAAGHENPIYGELSGDAPVLYLQTVGLWDPLGDDGDALRLAVRLDMELLRSKVNDPRPWVSAVIRNTTIHGAEDLGSDPYAATRRAITRAAAAIGKEMSK